MQSPRKTQSLFLKDFSKLKTQKFDVDIGGNVLNLILDQIFFKTEMKKIEFFLHFIRNQCAYSELKGNHSFYRHFFNGFCQLGIACGTNISTNMASGKVVADFCTQTCAQVSAQFTQLLHSITLT